MKKIIFPVIFASALCAATLENRIEELEMFRDMSFIKINGGMKVRYDNVNTESSGSEYSMSPLSLYSYLDFSADISDRLQFYSRIAASKFFNSLHNNDERDDFSIELGASRNEDRTRLHLERAFINYKLTDSLTFSAGRLPTIDGPPYEVYDNMPRLGTYPALAYNVQLDGLAFTYNLGKLLPFELLFRMIYSPTISVSRGTFTGELERAEAGKVLTNVDYVPSNHELVSVMAEANFKKNALWDRFNVIVQHSVLSGLKNSDVIPRGTDLSAVLAMPELGGNGIPATATGTTFSGSTANLGYKNTGINLAYHRLAGTGLNLNLAYALSTVESTGFFESSPSLIALKSNPSYATLLNALGVGRGFMCDEASCSKEGTGLLVNMSYNLPIKAATTVGAEFFKGSKNYTYLSSNTDELTNFYGTRGSAYHAWISQPFEEQTLKLRLGFMMQNRDYSYGLFGPVSRINQDVRTLYVQLRLDF